MRDERSEVLLTVMVYKIDSESFEFCTVGRKDFLPSFLLSVSLTKAGEARAGAPLGFWRRRRRRRRSEPHAAT